MNPTSVPVALIGFPLYHSRRSVTRKVNGTNQQTSMPFLHGRRSHHQVSSKIVQLPFPSSPRPPRGTRRSDGHVAPECVERVSLNSTSLTDTLSCHAECRDLNRYMALCGYSGCIASRVLALI